MLLFPGVTVKACLYFLFSSPPRPSFTRMPLGIAKMWKWRSQEDQPTFALGSVWLEPSATGTRHSPLCCFLGVERWLGEPRLPPCTGLSHSLQGHNPLLFARQGPQGKSCDGGGGRIPPGRPPAGRVLAGGGLGLLLCWDLSQWGSGTASR